MKKSAQKRKKADVEILKEIDSAIRKLKAIPLIMITSDDIQLRLLLEKAKKKITGLLAENVRLKRESRDARGAFREACESAASPLNNWNNG